ncbi:MAG: ATP-binding protein [Actinobacteria bacterium]|nr:ATP-binding protein [Actinomycetota bacterium]
MITPITALPIESLELQEDFDPRLISSLYQNYRDPISAILELIDNAVDDIIKNKTMFISIIIQKDSLEIVDKGGKGMNLDDLRAFFKWGYSSKKGKLGRYGQGGKAAMGYLGKSWVIETTKIGEDKKYVVSDDDWDDRQGGLKKFKAEEKETTDILDGVVKIDIKNLKRKISKTDLEQNLGKVYRPLLKSGQIEIYTTLNNNIEVLDYPLQAPEEHFEFKLKGGQIVKAWLGLLQRGSKIRGGVRCYAFGRLIVEKEFFGPKDPSFKQSIDLLIGELYIEFEDLPLTMNKSDIDRGSSLWEEIREEMIKRMDPYIRSLLEEKDKDLPTEKEQKIAEEAGVHWADFLRSLNNQEKQGLLPGLPIDHGQKIGEPDIQKVKNNPLVSDPTGKKYQPATPPPLERIGKRKRTGGYPKPKLHPLPEMVRYQLVEDAGIKIIKINTSYPLYKLRMSQIPLYIYETLAFEYSKDGDSSTQTVNEYIEEINDLLHQLGLFLRKNNIKIDS